MRGARRQGARGLARRESEDRSKGRRGGKGRKGREGSKGRELEGERVGGSQERVGGSVEREAGRRGGGLGRLSRQVSSSQDCLLPRSREHR